MINSRFWLGSKHQLDIFIKNIIDIPTAEIQAELSAQNEPKSYDIIGKTAIIPINGPLLARQNIYSWWFGNSTYEGIENQINDALKNIDISNIILRIDSPGGVVTGIMDLVATLKKANEIKPITAYSDGMMTSAAYWIASASSKILITPTAEVASIGVILIHSEFTKFFDEAGIKNTIFRSGEKKAIGTPYEELSEDAREKFQEDVNYIRMEFAKSVSENRNIPIETVLETESTTLIGNQALKNKLIDGIDNFSNLIYSLKEKERQKMENEKLNIEVSDLTAKVTEFEKQIAILKTDNEKLSTQLSERDQAIKEMKDKAILGGFFNRLDIAQREGKIESPIVQSEKEEYKILFEAGLTDLIGQKVSKIEAQAPKEITQKIETGSDTGNESYKDFLKTI